MRSVGAQLELFGVPDVAAGRRTPAAYAGTTPAARAHRVYVFSPRRGRLLRVRTVRVRLGGVL